MGELPGEAVRSITLVTAPLLRGRVDVKLYMLSGARWSEATDDSEDWWWTF